MNTYILLVAALVISLMWYDREEIIEAYREKEWDVVVVCGATVCAFLYMLVATITN